MKNILTTLRVFLPVLLLSTGAFMMASCLSGGGGGSSGTVASPVPPAPAGSCLNVTYAAASGAASNIVFNFDRAYQCGQFANGDWWVSPDSAGGTVRIVSITPDGIAGKHGVEINPLSTTDQAFDNQAEVPYNAALLAVLPRNVSGGSSVVKAVSILPKPASRPILQYAAVLTVLDTPLLNSAQFFRPPYFGTTKTLYPVSDVNLAALPKLPASAIPGFDKPSILPPSGAFLSVLERFTGVRLDHVGAFTGRDIHPKDNMPDYGAQIATDNAVYLLRMAVDDFDPSANAQHTLALVNYLQTAIDLQAMAVNGTNWNATGGHSIGRKLPLAFAAKAFTTAGIKAGFTTAIATAQFDEDRLLFRSPINNKVLYGQSGTDFQYWQATLNGGTTGAKDVRDPYGLIDGGGEEVGNPTPALKGYQYCCSSMPWKYTALAIYTLNLETEFNGPLLLEYAERWVNWGVITLADSCAPFDGITAPHPALPPNYNVTYGSLPGGPPYNCIVGAGRWPARDGAEKDDGNYKSIYGNNLWTWYKAQPGAKTVPWTH
jgi:hypothetical protein